MLTGKLCVLGLLLCVANVSANHWSQSHGCPNSDYDRLVYSFQDINNLPNDWYRGCNVCDWTDVHCFNGRVTGVQLVDRRISGNVRMDNLPEMMHLLDLQNNQLSGKINCNGIHSKLQYIHLEKNNFNEMDSNCERQNLPVGIIEFVVDSNVRVAGNGHHNQWWDTTTTTTTKPWTTTTRVWTTTPKPTPQPTPKPTWTTTRVWTTTPKPTWTTTTPKPTWWTTTAKPTPKPTWWTTTTPKPTPKPTWWETTTTPKPTHPQWSRPNRQWGGPH